tara:strand:- start:206 stop:985 length:780 start_codon:yes stop_codon:yes gene_type:complete
MTNLDNIIIIKKKKLNLHWIDIYKKCFFNKWDIVIDFRTSLISYLLLHKKKYIFKKNNQDHHLTQLSNFFGFNCKNLKIYNSNKEIEEVNQKLVKKIKYIVICPGGNWKPKIWSSENYNTLIKRIKKDYNHVKFILVGSKKEEVQYYRDVVKDIKNEDIINLMNQSITLTSAYMKKSNLFIGNDSGLMHLSVSSNLTTIGLFGPTNDKIYGHRGKNYFVIRTRENYEDLKKNIFDESKSFMDSIEVNDILQIIQKNRLL